jgi:DNA-binding transcriptional LysR family regulator
MNLRQLEIFHAIMRTSSMTEAARRLNISQPAVSSMLKHAESQLGMKLFERVGGRLRPTPEAEILFPDVSGIFARLETVRNAAQALRDARSGVVSVAASPTLANAILPGAVAAFRRDRPQVRVVIQSLPTETVARRVADRECDLGVAYEPTRREALDAEIIGAARIACVMRKDHPLAARSHVRPQDLEGEPVITYGPTTPFGSLIAAAFEKADAPLSLAVDISHSLTACFLAGAGAGIALIDPIVPLGGAFPGLVVKRFQPPLEVKVQLLLARDRPHSVLAARLADEIRRQFRGSVPASEPRR